VVTGDRNGYLTLFTETGTGLRNDGWIRRDSATTTVPINVGWNSFPFINDWNADGRKDLIVGEETTVTTVGSIRVYLNTGTNAAPRFGSFTYVQAGGSPLYVYRANPVIYDLDRDNVKDLILGNNDGNVYFYKNVGTNAAPVFATARETLKLTTGTVINAYYGSRLSFVDWRGDGDIDMLLSGYYSYVDLYENAFLEVAEGKLTLPAVQEFKVTPSVTNRRAVVSYYLTQPGKVRIDLYSADGRLVATPLSGYQDAGSRQLSCNTRDLTAGVYLVRLSSDRETVSARMVVVH